MELTDKIRRVYLPMTETGFYILFCLQKEGHGYSITQKVKEITDSQVLISPGTMYGTLSKMEKDGLISFVRVEEKRKIYQIKTGLYEKGFLFEKALLQIASQVN